MGSADADSQKTAENAIPLHSLANSPTETHTPATMQQLSFTQHSSSRLQFVATPPPLHAATQAHCFKPFTRAVAAHASSPKSDSDVTVVDRRQLLSGTAAAAALAAASLLPPGCRAQSLDDDFVVTPSGLKVLDVKTGTGASPQPGDTVVVHWAGVTKGYQGKRIDNTSVRDEPYEFVLGSDQTIKAFQEAVSSMQVGGIRRIEVPGDHPDLAYPRDRSLRFTNELVSRDGKIFKFRYGPQPAELGGQRALDFILDNGTLQDFNRTLLFDIKLLSVRKAK